MKPIYLSELVLLGAIWGASFMFLRIGTPEFGPIALVGLRTLIGTIVLLPFMFLGNHTAGFVSRWKSIFSLAVISIVFPYTLFSYTTLYASSGYTAILNATTVMFAAVIAFVWLKDSMPRSRIWGVGIGFFGVTVLMLDKASIDSAAGILPTLAALCGGALYGLTACYTRRYLLDLNPLITAAGSQLLAASILLPFIFIFWPEQWPGTDAWLSVIVLGILCTGIATLMYFRLIERIGATSTATVTYLIPLFGILFGNIFLDEAITIHMLIGGGLILLGVGFATGLGRSRRQP